MSNFQELMTKASLRFYEIEQSGINELTKENLKRKYFGLRPLTKLEFDKQQEYYEENKPKRS